LKAASPLTVKVVALENVPIGEMVTFGEYA